VAVRQRAEHLVVEAERLDRVEQATGAGHHPVPAAVRQPAGEDLEHRPTRRRARGHRALQHRQLVVVGEQCRAGRAGHARRLVASPPRPRACRCWSRG
jgi:hypothetical protein